MNPIARFLILAGLILLGAGLLFLLFDKIPWVGRLPGDITIRREKFTFYFPLATCILISVILSLILWFLRK
jgi:hypothetical protein